MVCERKLPLQKGRFEINWKVVPLWSSSLSHIPTLTYHRCNLYHPLMHRHQIPNLITNYENYLMSRVNCIDLSSSSDTLSRPYHRYWDQLQVYQRSVYISPAVQILVCCFNLRCLVLYESKVGVMRKDDGNGGCERRCRKGGCGRL